jgi:hypothetical protein
MAMITFISMAFADPSEKVSLTDIKGRTISVIIVKVTDQEITANLDGKIFKIDRATLNQESKEKIAMREKSQLVEARLVEKHAFTLSLIGNKNAQILLSKGPFVVEGKGDYIRVKFDNDRDTSVGEVWIIFREIKGRYSFYKNVEEMKKENISNIIRRKNGMTPRQAARVNENPDLPLVQFGDFSGYLESDSPNFKRYKLTNEKYGLEVSINRCNASYMDPETVAGVIKSIRIK